MSDPENKLESPGANPSEAPAPAGPTTPPARVAAGAEPKINQRMKLRYAIALLTIAAFFFAWYFLRDFNPADVGNVDTTGWVLALKETSDGTQAVAIKDNGSVIENPQPSGQIQDRDLAWLPNGQRAFFTSNRDAKKEVFNVYRWNLAKNTVEQRTTGSRTPGSLWFDPSDVKDPRALMVLSGVVVEFDPKTGSTLQILPPRSKDITADRSESGGAASQFGPEYEKLGSSFVEARWCGGHKFIAAVMRRDDGETLILQNMDPKDPQEGLPEGVVAGDKIQIAIDPQTDNVIYTVQNYHFLDPQNVPPQNIKDGKLIKPYQHGMGILAPVKPEDSGLIIASPDNKVAFGAATPSPDGSVVVYQFGPYDGGLNSSGLLVMPLKKFDPKAVLPPSRIVQGQVGPPSWNPSGDHLTFVMRSTKGTRDVWRVKNDGSELTDLTQGSGVNYEAALFSPAVGKPKS
jgi:hypothetical protein